MPSTLTAADALQQLKAGNARFVSGSRRTNPFHDGIAALAGGQNPFAIVLGCSDSRVPIETIFDQDPGNVFVVRVAGNFANNDNLGSIEYGVEVLGARLVLVLGHARCGAVTAALDYVRDGVGQRGHIQELVEAVAPAVRATRGFPGDWLENAVAYNVALNVRAVLAGSKIVSDLAEAGQVQVTGGIYSLSTGIVTFT